MANQNVTLSIPKSVLQKAKHIAIENNTSLSGLLSCYIEEIVKRDEQYKTACFHHISMLEKGIDLGTGGICSWKREELLYKM